MHYRLCRMTGIVLLGATAFAGVIGMNIATVRGMEIPSALVQIVTACVVAIAGVLPAHTTVRQEGPTVVPICNTTPVQVPTQR